MEIVETEVQRLDFQPLFVPHTWPFIQALYSNKLFFLNLNLCWGSRIIVGWLGNNSPEHASLPAFPSTVYFAWNVLPSMSAYSKAAHPLQGSG